MKKGAKKFLAALLSVAMVLSAITIAPAGYQKNVWAVTNEDISGSVVTEFSYDFAYTTPGYADGTIRISASEDGVYKVFWGDAEGNKLTKNGYEYSYLARVIVKDGKGSYNIISDYTAIPEDAETVLVYKKDVLHYVYNIPAEKLLTPAGEGYSFGALSDLHYGRYSTIYEDDAVAAVDNAFEFLNNAGIEFVGTTGDLTSEGEQTSLDKYNAAIAKYPNMTVLSVTGNHDSRTTVSTSDSSKLDTSLIRWYDSLTSTYFTVHEDGTFTSNLDAKYTIPSIGTPLTTEYREAAGEEAKTKELPALDFVVTDGDNVFVFLNEISKTGTTYDVDKLLTTAQMDWLAEQFETYKDKNVFLFAHSYLPVNTLNNDSIDYDNSTGDLKNEGGYSYDLDFKDYVATSDGRNMLALFKQYSNVTMFSGHSHWQYSMQEHNPNLNIGRLDNGTGATLIHLSSVTEPRYVGDTDTGRTMLNGEASEGTIVTVYDDCIIYNSVDFYNSEYEAYATYIVPLGDESVYEPVKNAGYRESTDAITGDEYLEAEDMTRIQLLKSNYNLMLGAGYQYSSKGSENTDGALTDGSSTGSFMNTRENKNADQYIIVTLDGEQEVSNLKEFMLYFVNGLTNSSSFNIQLSLDGENYETVGTYTDMVYTTTTLAVDTSNVTLEKYKYIKLNLTDGAKAYGYQIREFAAIGYAKNATPNTAGSSSSIVEGVIDEEDFLPSDYNLVYGADYTQSSVGGENNEGKLTDGKTSGGFVNTERDSSAIDQNIVIDLGKGNTHKVNNIDYFLLYFQNDMTNATAFNVSVSLDGTTYETVGTYTNVDIETNHFDADLSNVTLEEFRYVKLHLTAGKTGYGYQIKEFGVIGVNPIEYPEIADQSSLVSSAEKNLALYKTVYVSSTYANEGKDPGVLTDGKKGSYWSSDWDNTRTSDYVIIDLGAEVHTSTIGSVVVNYKSDNTFCGNYSIEFSKTYNEEDPTEGFYEVARTKAVSWEILQKLADSNGYVVTPISDVEPDTIRYVKVNMSGHANYGFQVYETAVIVKEMTLNSADCEVSVEETEYTYSGEAIEPEVTVTFSGVELTKDTDYTVTYDNNVNAGEASYTVTGNGAYSGSVNGTFTINPKNISDEDVVIELEEYMNQYGGYIYQGTEIIPDIYSIDYNENPLVHDVDYTVTCNNNVNPGEAIMYIEGKGNFTGTKTYTYTIVAAPMEYVSVNASYDADGKLVVVAKNGDAEMVEGQDYTVTEETDENNNAVITVTATGTNYSGTFVKTIYDLANVTVDDSNLKDFEFEGKDKTPIITLTHDGKQLNINADYEVKYENNFYPGTATITITGIGDYKGEIVRTFNIVKKTIGNVTVRTSFDANKQLVVKVNNGSYAMTEGVDYTYTVVTDADGNITITFTGLGDNYSGTFVKTIAAENNPNRPTPTVAPTTTAKAPGKAKIKKVTAKKIAAKKVKLSLKKIANAKGYEVAVYKTKKNAKKNKKVLVKKTYKKVKVTIKSKKLKNKKALFVRVRAYNLNADGTKVYGKWSKVKKVKIKK